MATTLANGTAVETGTSFYKHIFTDLADPRTNDWFLISSPIPWVTIMALYIYAVLVFLPKYMNDKKPFKLTRVLRIYNFIQVLANIWIFKEVAYTWSGYNWNCQPVDYSNSPDAIRIAWTCYLYFLNKMVDLSDTVFFRLRKNEHQVTFLHVFHHSFMVFATWSVTKYYPGGNGTFIGLLNTFVHILLYSYYYLAAFGPKVQKYLWWKRYLTKIQLIQFLLILIHNLQLLFITCDFPKWTILFTMPNTAFFFYLFSDFYKKAYMNPEPKIQKNEQNGISKKVKTK